MNILLDPYILAVPRPYEKRTIEYLENLEQWTAAIRRQGKARFWTAQVVFDALWDENLYPTWETIAQLEAALPADKEINAQTALRACEREIFEPPLLDELVDNQTLYYEGTDVIIIPPAIADRLPRAVADAFRETLALAAVGSYLQVNPLFKDLVFGTVANGFQEKDLLTEFDAQNLEDAETHHVSKSWTMFFSPEQLYEIDNLIDIWQNTPRAIRWVHHKLYSGDSRHPLPKVSSSAEFNASIKKYSLDKRSASLYKIFRKIVQAATGDISKNQKIHHRLHRNGKNITRGRIIAWRLWIENATPGWRVHYWQYPNGEIELACLVKHDDYTIPEPSKFI